MGRLDLLSGYELGIHALELKARLTTWCQGQAAAQLVYSAEGDTGGGLVHLFSQGKLVKLRWKKGQLLEQGLSGSQGWRPDAIWGYDQEEGYLQRARFEQRFQPQVRAAAERVKSHYASLRKAHWTSALGR